MWRSRDAAGRRVGAVSRRDLFRLKADPEPARDPSPATYDLLNAARPAMGCHFEVRLPARTPDALDLATRALDVVEDLDNRLTVYRDDSEVVRINAEAHLGPVEVEPDLFGLVERAVALWAATGGAYDLTAGALSVAWGFTRGPRRVPDPDMLAEARRRTGSDHLTLDPGRRTIAFDRAGVVLNLGSIGKGYAIDRAVAVVRDHWYPTPCLIHGGRSSLYALGSPPDQFGGRWGISVRNPLDPDHPVGVVRLRNRGMGTSGAAFQRFEEGGRTYGHLIDPRTGEPPERGPLSLSVLAPTAADADALSTAFYLLGPEAAAAYSAAHPEVGFLFLLAGTDPARPEVVTHGLTAADLTLS